MKKNSLLIILIGILFCLNAHSQTYYYMWRGYGDSGKPEWIANTAMLYDFTGILHVTNDRIAGWANASGRWFFINPYKADYSKSSIVALNNRINSIGDLTIGTTGHIGSNKFLITNFATNSDILGLLGPGRGENLTLESKKDGLLRIGGKEGIAFWSDGNAGLTDTPNMILTKEGLFQVKNDIGFLAGNVLVKSGRNNNPTLISKSDALFRVSGKNGVAIWGNNNSEIDDSPKLRIENNVGIDFPLNTSLPYKFNVAGSMYTENQGIRTLYGTTVENTNAFIGTTSNHGLYLGTNNGGKLYLATNGSAWIGVSEQQRLAVRQELLNKYMLFVGKGILSEDFAIAPVASWADFVFNSDYRLKPLHQVEIFIKENKHLPDVPSAKDVAENGYSQHEMNKALLQKIEELTLYAIEQQKKIEALEAKLTK